MFHVDESIQIQPDDDSPERELGTRLFHMSQFKKVGEWCNTGLCDASSAVVSCSL